MFTPVTSIVGSPSASRIRRGEVSVTSPPVEWTWPTSMSPTSSVATETKPFVVMKICGTVSGGGGTGRPVSRSVSTAAMSVLAMMFTTVSTVPVVAQDLAPSPVVVTWQRSMSSPARTSANT